MHAGQYISGAGHLALIAWVLLGGVFSSEPPPFETTEVSVISGEEFEALLAAQRSPDSATEVAQPEAPDVTEDAPQVDATPDDAVEQPDPVQTENPPEDTPPETVQEAPPQQAEVTDEPPVLDEPVGDVAVLTPNVAPEAAPRPVERVAPEPVAQPDPEAAPDVDSQEAVAPDETGETVEEPQEATAPDEATTEIVTEATAAPASSARPPGQRPSAPAPQVAETDNAPANETPATPQDTTSDAVTDALAAALAEEPAAPSGPPLNAGEKESMRVAVSNCWNTGSLSSAALNTTVVIAVSMTPDGIPVQSSIRMIGSSGGSDSAARQAFEAARRAILRCQKNGYPLPQEKYDHWKEIEMTFNPEKMRMK